MNTETGFAYCNNSSCLLEDLLPLCLQWRQNQSKMYSKVYLEIIQGFSHLSILYKYKYICQTENNEGVTEVKVVITVEGGPGAPVASVSATEMTVVEGHTVTMECQASGRTFSCLCF